MQDISEELVKDVSALLSKHRGKHSLILNIIDHKNKYQVDLLSRKNKLNLDKSFFEGIDQFNQLKIKIR